MFNYTVREYYDIAQFATLQPILRRNFVLTVGVEVSQSSVDYDASTAEHNDDNLYGIEKVQSIF